MVHEQVPLESAILWLALMVVLLIPWLLMYP